MKENEVAKQVAMKMLRADIIDDIRNRVGKNRFANIDELEKECKRFAFDIEPFDDILSPMGWNCCDRCGELGDSELDLNWLEYGFFDYIDDNPKAQAILRGYEKEEWEYACVCDRCIEQMAAKGGWVKVKYHDTAPEKVKVLTS